MKWQSSGQLVPFSVRTKEPRGDVTSIGPEFLRRFQSPTIFLKISCDGDFLLPIIVGTSINLFFLGYRAYLLPLCFCLLLLILGNMHMCECDSSFIAGEFAVDKLLYALLEDGGDEVGVIY